MMGARVLREGGYKYGSGAIDYGVSGSGYYSARYGRNALHDRSAYRTYVPAHLPYGAYSDKLDRHSLIKRDIETKKSATVITEAKVEKEQEA